jgi:hypothetical protein
MRDTTAVVPGRKKRSFACLTGVGQGVPEAVSGIAICMCYRSKKAFLNHPFPFADEFSDLESENAGQCLILHKKLNTGAKLDYCFERDLSASRRRVMRWMR